MDRSHPKFTLSMYKIRCIICFIRMEHIIHEYHPLTLRVTQIFAATNAATAHEIKPNRYTAP